MAGRRRGATTPQMARGPQAGARLSRPSGNKGAVSFFNASTVNQHIDLWRGIHVMRMPVTVLKCLIRSWLNNRVPREKRFWRKADLVSPTVGAQRPACRSSFKYFVGDPSGPLGQHFKIFPSQNRHSIEPWGASPRGDG